MYEQVNKSVKHTCNIYLQYVLLIRVSRHLQNLGYFPTGKVKSGFEVMITRFIYFSMNKKWAVKRITINLASNEAKNLEKYCEQTGRPATDVIRELIRALPLTK
jgi:hypothetical protein